MTSGIKKVLSKSCKIDESWKTVIREVALVTKSENGFAQLAARNIKSSSGSCIKATEYLLRQRVCKHQGLEAGSAIWDLDKAVGNLTGEEYTDACDSVVPAVPNEWVNGWGYLMAVSTISTHNPHCMRSDHPSTLTIS
jgi:hypothetical protein